MKRLGNQRLKKGAKSQRQLDEIKAEAINQRSLNQIIDLNPEPCVKCKNVSIIAGEQQCIICYTHTLTDRYFVHDSQLYRYVVKPEYVDLATTSGSGSSASIAHPI